MAEHYLRYGDNLGFLRNHEKTATGMVGGDGFAVTASR